MNEITIPVCYLEATNLFAAKADKRYYLNGVVVQDGYIAGTDGCVIAVIDFPDSAYMPSTIIPRNVIDLFAKKCKKAKIKHATLTVDTKDKKAVLHCGAVQEHFAPIDGRYPDIRQVIPQNPSGFMAQFCWDQVAKYQRAAEVLGARKSTQLKAILTPDGKGRTALVKLRDFPEFTGAVTPFLE